MNKPNHKEQFEMFAKKANKLGLIAVEKSIKLASIEIDKNIYWMQHSYEDFKEILEQLVKDQHINLS